MNEKTLMKKLLAFRPSKKFWAWAIVILIAIVAGFIVFPWIMSIFTGILLFFTGKGKNAAEKYVDKELAVNEKKREEAGKAAAAEKDKIDKQSSGEAHDNLKGSLNS